MNTKKLCYPNRTRQRPRGQQKGRQNPQRHLCDGVLERHPGGYGFLRRTENNLARMDDDVFVPESVMASFNLSPGVSIRGIAQRVRNTAGPRLVEIRSIEGCDPHRFPDVIAFEERTPVNPTQQLQLEHPDQPVAMRVLDLLTPVGRGQRALIASPPRAGKTTLLKQIGRSIALNHPDVHLVVLLVDERPEEVTDMRGEVDGQVFASNLDQDVANHVRLADLVINRCRRMAESGKDVCLLVDSLTRLARASNKLPNRGAIGAGGLNIRALDGPKQLFASARAFAEGGSLTIVASVLIETDNRMDEVIFREFKGTGNLDLVLSQRLADQRIWPAMDIAQSATRRVELLQDASTLRAVTSLRNALLKMSPPEGIRELASKLSRFRTNAEFISLINGQSPVAG